MAMLTNRTPKKIAKDIAEILEKEASARKDKDLLVPQGLIERRLAEIDDLLLK
jgi:hypothetical protein